ncbi:MAG: flagellin [Eubacteriales bacterium]
MVVKTNVQALNANRQLNITTDEIASSTEKLSSGYRINRAADDAAGLSISEKMRTQIRGLTQASANAQDGISFVQTAEGALSEVQDMLQRMNELAVQAANGTNSTIQQGYINEEIDALKAEIDRIGEDTKFNGMSAFGTTITFQVGSENTDAAKITISTAVLNTSSLSIGDKTVETQAEAQEFLDYVQADIEKISAMRSSLGAVQNRLEYSIKNLDNVVENTTAAESRIRDTDMSTEMVAYSNNNILSQAGQAMLAQANQANQGVLSLLG